MELGLLEKRELLQIARKTLQDYLRTGQWAAVIPQHAQLKEKAGAFVTLEKHRELRGCIGHTTGDLPLVLTVQKMVVEAAVSDPRFPTVVFEECEDIEIEISVLSAFKRINDISEIKVGKHGLMISRGSRRGLLLPQVPGREGWDR